MQVSELCDLRLANVDRVSGIVTVQGKRGSLRMFPLSADGKRTLDAYLDHAHLTPAWEPAVPEALDRLFLTERRRPLIKSSLTGLFQRLNLRAGLTRADICPSMLRDTYAIRFLQTGGDLRLLQEQLGLAGSASMQRYQHFCDEQQHREARVHALLEGQSKPPEPGKGGKRTHRKARR